ncbi:hypothetical protein N7535_000875 [Penicillium sp. DV-2018c]|nr:hypothetical protein N7535_000875 [Penicillium sp. DV-2018c]
MDSQILHTLLTPQGITKTKTNTQAQTPGRRQGKIACTACHARKKRCDIASPTHQCTHCWKEARPCIPRYTNTSQRFVTYIFPYLPIYQDYPDTNQPTTATATTTKVSRRIAQCSGRAQRRTTISIWISRCRRVLTMRYRVGVRFIRYIRRCGGYCRRRLLLRVLYLSLGLGLSLGVRGEKEGDGDGEEDGTVRVKEEVGERSDSGFGDGDCGSMGSLDCSGGSGISTTSLDWDESLAPLGTKSVGLEQEQEQEQEQSQGEVAACDPRLLYRDLALEEAPHCGSGIDIGVGAGHDVFMNDLDALLRF